MSGFSLATAKDDGINCLVGEHQMYAKFHKHYRITLSAYGVGGRGFKHRAPGIFSCESQRTFVDENKSELYIYILYISQ